MEKRDGGDGAEKRDGGIGAREEVWPQEFVIFWQSAQVT